MGCGTVNTLEKKDSVIKVNNDIKPQPELEQEPKGEDILIAKPADDDDKSNRNKPISKSKVTVMKKSLLGDFSPHMKSNNTNELYDYYKKAHFDYTSNHNISNQNSSSSALDSASVSASNNANGFDTTIITMNTSQGTNANIIDLPKYITASDKSSLTVTVLASRFEAMYPIWIEKNKEITFEVSGKWRTELYGMDIPADGIKNNTPNKAPFNHGSLVGRVLNNPYFAISTNSTTYQCEESGPLFFKMNLNSLQSQPIGELKVKVYGGIEMSFSKIEEKLGWIDTLHNPVLTNNTKKNSEYTLPQLEKATIVFINKLRYNSSLFALQYLENISSITPTMKNIYTFLKQNDASIKALEVNVELVKDLESYYIPILTKNQRKDKGESSNGNSNRNSNSNRVVKYNIQGSLTDLELYLKEKYPFKKIAVFIKRHDDGKAMSLAIRFLLDDRIKNEIFDEGNTEIAMITLKSIKMNKKEYISIVVFSQRELGGYDEKKGFAPKLEGYKNNFSMIKEENARGVYEIKGDQYHKPEQKVGIDNNENDSETQRNNNKQSPIVNAQS